MAEMGDGSYYKPSAEINFLVQKWGGCVIIYHHADSMEEGKRGIRLWNY